VLTKRDDFGNAAFFAEDVETFHIGYVTFVYYSLQNPMAQRHIVQCAMGIFDYIFYQKISTPKIVTEGHEAIAIDARIDDPGHRKSANPLARRLTHNLPIEVYIMADEVVSRGDDGFAARLALPQLFWHDVVGARAP